MTIGKIEISRDACKGCGYCIEVCPNRCIVFDNTLNQKGYIPALFSKREHCIGCTHCAVICPEIAITVWRATTQRTKGKIRKTKTK
ncbi:MAG: ferredoxin family protein [Thermodesulfovibrionales bacterium]